MTHVDLGALVCDLRRAADLLRKLRVHFDNKVHHALVIRVRLIKLDRREFGVVLRVHALVSEDSADLVYAVESADDQPLQIKLRLDAQVHIHVERVVMRDERASRRADLERSEDRGVNLEKSLGIEISADLAEDKAALHEGVLDLGVHYEIDVALTVAHIGVGQSVELLGQGEKRLRKKLYLINVYGDLAAAGAEHRADDVADIPLAVLVEGFFADIVYADVALDPAGCVHDVDEVCLAHVAAAHHSSGDADGLAIHLVEIVLYVLRVCVKVESDLLEGIASCGDESGKLVPANLKDFGKRRLGRGVFNVFVHDKISPFLRRGRQK